MLVKNHYNKNDYCLSSSGHWVRNFTKPIAKPIDVNELIPFEDLKLILENEIKNEAKHYPVMENAAHIHENVLILGDGLGYEEVFEALDELPANVVTVGVNGIFSKWQSKRKLNYYVVNNPYRECLNYFPQSLSYWPKCIASIRTNPKFLEAFQGTKFLYYPATTIGYSGIKPNTDYFIDDYRNAVCAALGVAYKFRAKRIVLANVLELFQQERPGLEQVAEDVWLYPQQKMAHSLIDANLYWLQKAKINVHYTQKKPDYNYATYISLKEMRGFFNEKR